MRYIIATLIWLLLAGFGFYIVFGRTNQTARPIVSPATPEAPSKAATPIDITAAVKTENIIATIKNEKPYILIDILPEVDNFTKHTYELQRDYLRKRALQICQEHTKKKEEFKNFKVIKVRMIMVSDSDEYGRGNWATAPELALFMVKNTPEFLNTIVCELDGKTIEGLLEKEVFNTKYIK